MKLPEEVSRLLSIFRTVYGQEMYVVGGAVRDTVLNKQINDYDIFLQRDGTDQVTYTVTMGRFLIQL